MKYLLDTCVISELCKRKPDTGVLAWLKKANPRDLYLSVMTVGEIKKGIAKSNDDERALELESWLNQKIRLKFADQILPVDEETALMWGRLTGAGERLGKPKSVVDALLAATASVHHLKIVTRNIKHLSGMGVELINPWKNS